MLFFFFFPLTASPKKKKKKKKKKKWKTHSAIKGPYTLARDKRRGEVPLFHVRDAVKVSNSSIDNRR